MIRKALEKDVPAAAANYRELLTYEKKMVPIPTGCWTCTPPGKRQRRPGRLVRCTFWRRTGEICGKRDSKPAPAGRMDLRLGIFLRLRRSAGDPHPMHSAQPGRARVWKAVRPVCPSPLRPNRLQGGPSGYLGGQQAGGCPVHQNGLCLCGTGQRPASRGHSRRTDFL